MEEMASILLTPFILYFSLPKCAVAITQFVGNFTQTVDGLGDVCSLAAFNLKQHGNCKYGSPHQAVKVGPSNPSPSDRPHQPCQETGRQWISSLLRSESRAKVMYIVNYYACSQSNIILLYGIK